jgi:hypothetical protein
MMDPEDGFANRIRELEKRIQAENASSKKIPDLNLKSLTEDAKGPPLNFNLMSPSVTRKKPKPCKNRFFLEEGTFPENMLQHGSG